MAAQFIKFGVPMIGLIVGGSFALKEFTEIKIKRRDEKIYRLNREEALKAFPNKGREVLIEEAYKNSCTITRTMRITWFLRRFLSKLPSGPNSK